ncbi:uncharacterized protein LOC103524116 [Trichonephila clavipes]|nr:uncharacterized protein LOC103524116 [Trichonephila clavipes]
MLDILNSVTGARTLQNILKSIFDEEIPALYGKDIDKVELLTNKASSHTSKSTAVYLAKKEPGTGIKCIPFDEIPVKSHDVFPLDFHAFGLKKRALGMWYRRTLNGLWKTTQKDWNSTSALQALSNLPSHCGLWGNERADFLAKKGTGILQNFRRDLTLHSAKLEIKRIFRESFRLTASRVARDKPWSTLCKKSHGISSSPRSAAVAKFRLLTGHDCLCAHLFRFNLVTSLICVLCDTGQDMTAAHLDECSALNDLNCIVKRYWRARCLMT